MDGLEEARKIVNDLKSRGVTRFLDLNRVNKRQIDDVASDEEADEDMDFGSPEPPLRRLRTDGHPEAPDSQLQPGQPAAPDAELDEVRSQAETEYTPSINPVPVPSGALPAPDLPDVPAVIGHSCYSIT